MASTGDTWRLGHRPALDGLRGIAILLVLLLPTLGVVFVSRGTTANLPDCWSPKWPASASHPGVYRTVVIGDSYASGYLVDPSSAWTSQLPGQVITDGIGGTGFTTALSPCKGGEFAQRAVAAKRFDPDVVVIEGGLNDYRASSPEIRRGVRLVLDQLRDVRVVLVGPAAAPERAAEVPRVDRVLAQAAERAGVQYVSTRRWDLDFLPDGVHLTPLSHRAFGLRVARAIGGGGR